MSSFILEESLKELKEIASSDLERSQKISQALTFKEKLLKDENLLVDLFTKTATAEQPEGFLPPDINGFSLYRDPGKQFSMHVFVWAPSVPYPIHDHGSWGIVGLYRGKIEETKWAWLGEENNHVLLEAKPPKVYSQGQAFYVLPLEEGPHSMRALGNQTAISIHTYGKPVRKSMLRMFHPSFEEKGKFNFYYTYPLYAYRRILAIDALKAVNPQAGSKLENDLVESSGDKVLVSILRRREENSAE